MTLVLKLLGANVVRFVSYAVCAIGSGNIAQMSAGVEVAAAVKP